MLATSEILNEESFFRTSFSPLTNVQPTHSYFQVATGMEAIVPYESGMSSDSYPETVFPYLEITVQPTDKFRFRYKSESGSHGKLRGASKNRAKTNFPTVKLRNYDSNDKIEIIASLYTNEGSPRPHVLELVGKNCLDGKCSEMLSEDNTSVFRYLEIESKKKDELITILSQNKIDLCGEDYDEEEIRREALNEYKALNTNAARLCFEAFRGSTPVCEKVFSGPIINLKSASSDLKIIRISLAAGRCSGGEDMILLCNKINKDDIKIRFYEKDENETIFWEDYGTFNKSDVHHQVAIPFKTPKYYQNTEKLVYIELYQPSDDKSGVAVQFTYIPDEIDALRFSKKRKYVPTESAVLFHDIMQPSSSSQFISSPSNVSSGTEEEDFFQGNPGPSSSDDNTSYPISGEDLSLSNDDLLKLLQLVDSDNFVSILENGPNIEACGSTKDDQAFTFEGDDNLNPSCQMDSATEFQTASSDELDMDNQTVTLTLTSRKSDHLFYKSIEYFSQLADSVVSFMQNPLSSPKGAVGVVDMAYGVSASANNHSRKPQKSVIQPQMLSQSYIDHRKSAIPRPHGNVAEHVEADITTRDKTNLGDSNKNFEQFKKGIGDILSNRKKDAFLRYIANLVSVEDENGNVLLHLAVLEQSQNLNLIAKILEIAPQNINIQNKYKETCLHIATMKDSWKVLLYLMARKGNPSVKNLDGNNCFHLAAKSNFVHCMKLLLLPSLKQGKCIPSLDDLNYEGLTPLHLSIMNNAKECMQLLLQAGANVNLAERKTGSSPLHIAIDQHPSLVGSLLSHPNINTDCTDFRGYTAYEAACKARGSAVIEELLKIAALNKNNERRTIMSLLVKDITKSQKLAVGTDEYDSSGSEISSDSDSEDVPNLPTSTIIHQDKAENIEYPNVDCAQHNFNTYDEEKLCQILDGNSGWRKLGKFIGFDDTTLNGLELLSKGSSPTKIILKKVKQLYSCDGKTLKNILLTAELEETVHMLESLNI